MAPKTKAAPKTSKGAAAAVAEMDQPGGNGKTDPVKNVHDKILTPGTKENAAFVERQQNLRIGTIRLQAPQPKFLNVRIGGITELIVHPFSIKALRQIEATHMRGPTKMKEPRKAKNPVEEMFWSFHWGMGQPGKIVQKNKTEGYCMGIPTFPLVAVKSAIVDTIRMQNKELFKKDLQRILFIRGFENLHHAPIEFNAATGMEGRFDYVKLANGQPDIRYRPEFYPWALSFQIEYLPEFWDEETILNAIQAAGYLNGLGEYRMERGGSMGRFAIDEKATGDPRLPQKVGKAKKQKINLTVTKTSV